MISIETAKIGFIGFGNMASAMADGWIGSGRVPAGNLYACANRFDALRTRWRAVYTRSRRRASWWRPSTSSWWPSSPI